MLYHDFSSSDTFLIVENPRSVEVLSRAVVGIKLKNDLEKRFSFNNPLYIVPYYLKVEDRGEGHASRPMAEMYNLLGGSNSGLFVSFVPADIKYVRRVKERVEEMVSRGEVRLTKNFGNRAASYLTGSTQHELYYDSDERRAFLSILSMLNASMERNGTSYKIGIVMEDSNNLDLFNYISANLLIVDQERLNIRGVDELYRMVCKKDAIPFCYENAEGMVILSDRIRKRDVISTVRPVHKVGLDIGAYLEGSVYETKNMVAIEPSTLNLGCIITGVPGTGKTLCAMNVISQVAKRNKTRIAIISPTEEWSAFGKENNMSVVRLYDTDSRINFFKCGDNTNTERFYENLAMLLAYASNAGPYRNSLEKCLLAAFHKIYIETRDPDPVYVYERVEESIIEQHAKRSNVGVKYTKHGENVKAALENLRLMLFKEQFAYQGGIDFTELLSGGVVFDLSRISNNMKPFFYALILNQIYCTADALEIDGDNELRMLICLEEAQLVFENDEESATTADLRQRIQDFRKKGVGIFLITHNVTDISARIRRLCQTKVYFRQSADIAKFAANDLIFNEEDIDGVINKIKDLEQRTCVLNYVENADGVKNLAGSVFIRIPEYNVGIEKSVGLNKMEQNVCPDTKIVLTDQNRKPIIGQKVALFYIGESIFEGKTDSDGSISLKNALKGKRHRLIVFGEKRSRNMEFDVIGGEESIIRI